MPRETLTALVGISCPSTAFPPPRNKRSRVFTVPYRTFPYPILPHLPRPYPILPYPTLPYPASIPTCRRGHPWKCTVIFHGSADRDMISFPPATATAAAAEPAEPAAAGARAVTAAEACVALAYPSVTAWNMSNASSSRPAMRSNKTPVGMCLPRGAVQWGGGGRCGGRGRKRESGGGCKEAGGGVFICHLP